MKIKEAFKKVETYNEIAELTHEGLKEIWFEETIAYSITNGVGFTDYAEFRKHVRKEYFKDVADMILESDDWTLNGEKEIVSKSGHEMMFGLYITAA